MIYGMCFDGSVVRGYGGAGRWLSFSNTRATGHVGQMELNYLRAREMGLTRLRDAVLWDEARRGPDYAWLDRLRAVSHGQMELALNHYGLPAWLTQDTFWGAGAAEALHEPALEVSWSPGLPILTHELGERMGGNLLSEDGTQHWHRPGVKKPVA